MSTVTTDQGIEAPFQISTLDDFRRWVSSDLFPEEGRIEFLDGELHIEMSGERIETHNKVKTAITVALDGWVEQRDLGEILGDGALIVNEAANIGNKPDVTFCSWERLTSGEVRYSELVESDSSDVEVIGSPDLTVEVVSKSSVQKDTQILPPRYFKAGVREYWLVDARRLEIAFTLFKRGANGFVAQEPDIDGFLQSDVLGAKVRLERKRTRIGTFSYKLSIIEA